MIREILTTVSGFVRELGDKQRPSSIPVEFPADHPLAGKPAGQFLLQRGETGHVQYAFAPHPRGPVDAHRARAELVRNHCFADIGSFASYLTDEKLALVFLRGAPFTAYEAVALLQENKPELGAVKLALPRHPAWERWSGIAGRGVAVDLTHEQLADLLLDNCEDLTDPMVAKIVGSFRAAKVITHNPRYDRMDTVTVDVEWQAAAQGEGTTAVSLPREFTASFPAFVGAWEPGQEPKHEARFRLRVMRPRTKEDAAPIFRMLWVNAADYESTAQKELWSAVSQKCPEHHVFTGKPDVVRYVSP